MQRGEGQRAPIMMGSGVVSYLGLSGLLGMKWGIELWGLASQMEKHEIRATELWGLSKHPPSSPTQSPTSKS